MDSTNNIITLKDVLNQNIGSSASAVDIELEPNASLIEVIASVDTGIYIKLGTTATEATSDSYIPAGQIRHYHLPNRKTGDELSISLIAESGTANYKVYQY